MSNPNTTVGPANSVGTLAITGATGTIGREVLTSLIAGGHERRVRAVVRNPADITADVQTVHADFSDPDTLTAAFDDAEAVLLLCGHHPDQLTYERAALAAATAAGVERVVYISAAAADRDPRPQSRSTTIAWNANSSPTPGWLGPCCAPPRCSRRFSAGSAV